MPSAASRWCVASRDDACRRWPAMTESFGGPPLAGYCPKCRQGYAGGPHVCAGHTPGPWRLQQESVDPDWHIVTAPGGRIMANVHIEAGNAMDEANARLITAAPDLLALAKQYASECAACSGTGRRLAVDAAGMPVPDVACDDCADIRVVIAKAERRS